MCKTLDQVREAYIAAVVDHLQNRNVGASYEGTELAIKAAHYIQFDWSAVESSFKAGEVANTGNATDFTCDFICRMLSEKEKSCSSSY